MLEMSGHSYKEGLEHLDHAGCAAKVEGAERFAWCNADGSSLCPVWSEIKLEQ